MQVHTTRDYGDAASVKSIIDGEVFAAGRTVTASTIAVTQTSAQQQLSSTNLTTAMQNLADAQARGDTQAAAQWAAIVQELQTPGGAPASSPTNWFSSNWPWLAAGVVGVFVVREVI